MPSTPFSLYDEYNYMKLVYSTLDKTTGKWSAPALVNPNSRFNECEFDVCVDENGVHILFTQMNERLDEGNVEDYAGKLDVYTCSYVGKASGSFTQPQKLSQTGYYKTNLEIFAADGVTYAAWTENADAEQEADKGLRPNEYKYFTIELNKVYFTEDYVTVTVKTDTEEFDAENNVMCFSMVQNEAIDLGISYTLTYWVDNKISKQFSYKAGETIDTSVMANQTKEGHSFSGWFNEGDRMPAHDLNVYGYFTPNRYQVIYYVDGKTWMTDEFEYGTPIAVRPSDKKEGHSFSGWKLGSADGELFRTMDMPARDVDLNATMTKKTYKIDYYIEGEETPRYTAQYTFGDEVSARANEVKEGYTFSGWKSEPSIMPACDVIVLGEFTVNRYEVSYYVNGTFYKTETLEYGAKVDLEGFDGKDYKVVGWTKDGEDVEELTLSVGNVRLDAKVKEKETPITEEKWFLIAVPAGGVGIVSVSAFGIILAIIKKKMRMI